ncbi:zinc finger protein 14-like [Haliotis rubra]|uniref:zinc finger protein 14-like n=1 Tax=Haliotis rubra TaxID=36100 RepID=UPI001EE59C4B|nr:zinc finger protein 14-like [Haliotis rubra]
MPRLSKQEREEVKEMLDKGYSQYEVSKKMKTSRSTIHRLVSRLKTTGSTDDLPRTGRPRIIPTQDQSWLECAGEERPFVCTECGKTFKHFHNLKNHLKTHGDERQYQCDQCGRGFISSANFKRHMRTHTGEKPYICEYCARGFADLCTMKTHIRTHTGERPHKCHLCGKACTTAGNLHAHMKVHRDKKGGEVPRPLFVKPPRYKSIPIFPQMELLKARNQQVLKEESDIADDSEAFDEDKTAKEEDVSNEDGFEDHQDEDNPHMLSVDMSSSSVTEFQEDLPAKIEENPDGFDDNLSSDKPKDMDFQKRFYQAITVSTDGEQLIPVDHIKKEPDFDEERQQGQLMTCHVQGDLGSSQPKISHGWSVLARRDPLFVQSVVKRYKHFHNLRYHLKTHGDKLQYQCDQCGHGFISSTTFKRHMRIHTGEKPYICEYCARGFADLCTMKTHIRTHTGERPHKCHLCGKACTTAGNLHAHMKVHRDKKGGEVPRPLFVKPPRYKSIPVFPHMALLKARNQQVLKEESDIAEAFDEDKTAKEEDVSNEDGLEDHQHQDNPHGLSVNMSSSFVTEFQEDLPAKIEQNPDGFEDNLSSDKPKDMDFQKRFCQAIAASSKFQLPIPVDHIKKEPDFEEEMNRLAMPRLSKEQREEVKKMLDKGYSQTEISKKMKTSQRTIHRLVSRLKTTGSTDDRPRTGRPRVIPTQDQSWLECAGEERPFVCSECGKTFKRFNNLKNHLKTHGDERQYQCDQCGRGFISSANFKRHMRTHTGEKPYICEYCARGFADLCTMNAHIRTHTGERPHKCHLCGKACTTAGNLHAHMKVHRDKKGGEVPRPLFVKPPRYKSIPVFPQMALLKARNQQALKEESDIADDSEAFDEDKTAKEEDVSNEDGLEDHQHQDNPHGLSVNMSSSFVTEFQEDLPAKIEQNPDGFEDNLSSDKPKDMDFQKRFCQAIAASSNFQLPIPVDHIKKEPDFEEERN